MVFRYANATCLIFLVLVASLPACSSDAGKDDSEQTYTLSGSQCTLTADVKSSAEASTQWTGCLVHYDAPSHVVTWQLIPSGTTTSLLQPGPGAIALSFDRDAPENTTFPLASTVSPLPAAVPPSQTVFAYGTQRGRDGGQGTANIGSNNISPRGGGGALSGTLDITTTSGSKITGTFNAQATPGGGAGSSGGGGSGTSGGSGGGGGCADNGASCSNTGACGTGGQRACYCAEAQTYQCFYSKGCYAEAGAATQVTRSQLISGCQGANSKAMALGGPACVTCGG